jgi:hypothetical protein
MINFQNITHKLFKILFTLIIIFCSTTIFATPIDSLRAAKVATNHMLRYIENLENFEGVEFHYKNTNQANVVMYYVFNLKNSTHINSLNGYVIVSADDACFPILGYSTKSKFDSNNLPVQLEKMLFHRAKEIAYIKEQGFVADEEIKQAWKGIENMENPSKSSIATRTERTEGVNPLISLRWDQSPFYNDLCPYDAQKRERAVTGCVATAMAQIMKYHNFPRTGQGIFSYTHEKYGLLSADFSRTTYDRANMPNQISSKNNAIATLMYHCGVSISMNYSVDGSSASTAQVAESLKKYFGYATTLKYVENKNYTQSGWIALLKSELDAKRPMQYRGSGTGGGHSFVCDGYNDNNFFHFNWGWGGSSDGYFNLNALNPGSLGTGGGSGGFNGGQAAIIGIQPATTAPTSTATNLQLNKKISVNPSPIGLGSDITVTFNIVNRGTTQFSGDYAVALFDDDYQFISYIGEIASNRNLNAGFTYTNDLSFTQKSVFLSEGDYYIGAYYREPQKQWQVLSQPAFENPVKVQVAGVTKLIKMYGTPMKVNSEPIFQNQPFEVTLNIANFETTTFEGEVSLDIYDSDGKFVAEIETKPNLSLGANKTFSNPLIFKNTGLDIPVGNYIIAPTYKKIIAGSTYTIFGAYKDNAGVNYPNLIRVIVAAAPLTADKFEVNNTESQASNLNVNFSNNIAATNTEGANLHVSTDIDHYKINLPVGFDYEVSARVHDNDDSGNGKTYTADVLFSYKINNGDYTDAFDISINDNNGKAIIQNGGMIVFKVAPFFAGDKGTYLLDIQVNRKQIVQPPMGIEDDFFSNQIKAYPNPTVNNVVVQFPENAKIESLKLFNVMGQEVLNLNSQTNSQVFSEKMTIDLSNYVAGVYYLYVMSDKKLGIKKISVLR